MSGRHIAGTGRHRTPLTPRRWPLYSMATGAIVVALISGTGIGATWALWSDQYDPTLQSGQGSVGIRFERLTAPASSATAAGPSSTLNAVLGYADAAAVVTASPQATAIALAVSARADGNAGITYGIALPAFPAGSVLGASTVRLFPVTSAAACTVPAAQAAAAAAQPATTGIVAIAPGTPADDTVVQYWCLGVVYPGVGGSYTNIATAGGTAPVSGLPATAQGSWTAYLTAQGSYALTHTVTYPEAP